MKRNIFLITFLLLAFGLIADPIPDFKTLTYGFNLSMGQNTANYREQGGARWVIGSGGSLDVASGGEIDIESGGAFKLAGTAMTTQLGYLGGVTAGTADASKALVLGAAKQIATITTATITNLDIGASGSVGTLDIFPATATNGKLTFTVQNQGAARTQTIDIDAMGQASVFNIGDPGAAACYFATSTGQLTLAEMDRLDGITAGTAYASKAVILGASSEINTITTAGITNLNCGADGTKGVFTVYPTTATNGSFVIDVTDQGAARTITLNLNAMGQSTVLNVADPGAAASYLLQSTAAVTIAEADVLDGATAGTQVANKAVIADANVNTGISKVTELHIGATGSEAQVTATPAEINVLASGIARSELTEDALAVYGIQINAFRAADGAVLGISETAGDHNLKFGTNVITLESENATSETEVSESYTQFIIPPEYVAAGDCKIRIKHWVGGAGTSNNSTVDIEVFEQDGNGAVGADICTTSATGTTEDSWTTTDFVVTGTDLVAGDILIIVFTSNVIENAAGALKGNYDGFAVLLDIKG